MSLRGYQPKYKKVAYLGPAARVKASLASVAQTEIALKQLAEKKKAIRQWKPKSKIIYAAAHGNPRLPMLIKTSGRIKPRTPARAKEEREYRQRSQLWLIGRVCAVVWKKERRRVPANQCHHKYGRRGRLLLWEPGWVAVSAEGHQWIQDHPTEATALGVLCEKGQWNDQSLVPR